MMLPLAKNALSRLQVRSIQQVVARQSHQKRTPDFHDKYGNAILAGGAIFCISTWTHTATQIGIEWNLSPVGRVTPKEWRDHSVVMPAATIIKTMFPNQLISDARLKIVY
ncbi:cytochrome c oxidase subunit 7B, mitochondrial-like [Acomys russatus]|uniref:cytochrome c oxidase subunit 7B, mitochondrial-like n=1 Tax=Acomys russatus TaxID=60746 RepID=UPI0021E1E4C8|nr:cytochrome c oxidase subunit 7B, mitochondrial-like [Acomys russatus]